jgi:phage/plasmid-like protein (TIGR03299 family)
MVRDKDHKVLHVPRLTYTAIQQSEVFAFGDALLDTGDVKYETAGSLREGRVIFVVAKLDREIRIDGEDEHVPYLVLCNTHDGSGAFRVMTSPIRVVCMNTLRLAIRNTYSSFSIRHTSGATKRVAEAKRAIGLTYAYYDGFEEEVNQLIATTVTDQKFTAIVSGLFPIKESMKDTEKALATRRRDTVKDVYRDGTIGPYHGTAWGVVNAVNEWEQWSTRYRRPGVKTLGRMHERNALRSLRDDYPYTKATVKALVK